MLALNQNDLTAIHIKVRSLRLLLGDGEGDDWEGEALGLRGRRRRWAKDALGEALGEGEAEGDADGEGDALGDALGDARR